MKQSSFEILLNPVRMGIIQNLIGDRRLSTQQISELLPEVPKATLYRHLKILLDAGYILVVSENPVRGTLEKIYSMNAESMKEVNKEAAALTKEGHKRYFFTYMVGLMAELESYLEKDDIDIIKDGLSYTQGKYYMTDEEYSVLITDLSTAFGKVVGNTPSHDRKSRTLGFVMLPDGKQP